jgi:hypothetical protein
MNVLIKRLPNDVVNLIITYTYSPQDPLLLMDIRSYLEQREALSRIYYKIWIEEWGEPEPEDKGWLVNDLLRNINDYEATLYCYTDKFYNTFYRNPMLKTQESVLNYFNNLNNKYVETQINILLGLLLPLEREIMICTLLATE